MWWGFWSALECCLYFLDVKFFIIGWWVFSMQYKCTSFLFASSKLLRKRWWSCSLIASENHVFPSMFFSRLTLFWSSTLLTAVIVFWIPTIIEPIRKRGRWWPCWCQNCFSGLQRLEKIELLERCTQILDNALNYCSDIKEKSWIHFSFSSKFWRI